MLYDLIVVGGGPAGYLAAERAGQAGLSVLLMEARALGGVCLNEGCIPTKTLLYSAKLFDGAAHGAKYGVHAEALSIRHAEVLARKDKVVRTLVTGVKAALRNSGVPLVPACGHITGASAGGYTVEADGESYCGKRLLLATGSSPSVPPIEGLEAGLARGFVLTSREILQRKEPPASLCVIGGGVIGLELASYFCSIGAKVTVIEMLDHIAGENDAELVATLKKSYEKRGVSFLLSAKVTRIRENAVCYEKDGQAGEIPCDTALLSIGRRPNTRELGLESIGVQLERGAIVTNAQMQTNVPNVYAAGDVNGKSMLAHTAYREAEVAVANMLCRPEQMRYDTVPGVLYTNPELAGVGETEASAAKKGLPVKCIRVPMRFSGRYLAENEGGDGMAKLLINTETETVAGMQMLSNYASECIIAAATFMEAGLTVAALKRIVFPHPTVSEIMREALFQY